MEESVSATQERNKELDAVVWWIVAFTSFFQSMHTLSTRATQWLLLFISVLLSYLGKFSEKIAYIARDFPSTIYRRAAFLKSYTTTPNIQRYVVCRKCQSL